MYPWADSSAPNAYYYYSSYPFPGIFKWVPDPGQDDAMPPFLDLPDGSGWTRELSSIVDMNPGYGSFQPPSSRNNSRSQSQPPRQYRSYSSQALVDPCMPTYFRPCGENSNNIRAAERPIVPFIPPRPADSPDEWHGQAFLGSSPEGLGLAGPSHSTGEYFRSAGRPPSGWHPSRPAGNSSRFPSFRSDRIGDRNVESYATSSHEPYETPPPPYSALASTQATSSASDPLIHPAIGRWPDQSRPALYWDMSSSIPPRYTRRDFTAEELNASPFRPPISRMTLVLDPEARWVFVCIAGPGEEYITLRSLLKVMAKLMTTPNMVPHRYWVRASSSKKEAIVKVMLKRTGKTLAVPPSYRRPKPRGQILEEAVMDGASNGYTNLLVIDLLCEDVMFAGLEFHKEPDEWVLRTTRRDW